MRVFVTGVSGQLGYDVVKELLSRGSAVVGSDITENEKSALLVEDAKGTASYEFAALDITDGAATEELLQRVKPDAVIHCAAYTAVDAAEDNEELCRKVNAEGTQNIANVCKKLDIKMLYISTDYVFGGEGERPWEPDDERDPQSVYGQTKYEGELAVQNTLEKYFIVRIACLIASGG